MIDIREVARQLAALDIKDNQARQAAAHALVRQYGVELLLNLRQAIMPTSPDELNIVAWLQEQIVKIAEQIPQPVETRGKAK